MLPSSSPAQACRSGALGQFRESYSGALCPAPCVRLHPHLTMKLSLLDTSGALPVAAEPSHMIERIVNLTLEVLYLLTGEDYIVLKMSCGRVTHSSSPCISGGFGRSLETPGKPPPLSMKPDSNKNILQLTSRIIELLTREEENKTGEEQKPFTMAFREQRDDSFLSEDESRHRNPAQSNPHPLHFRDSGEEGLYHLHQTDQSQNTMGFRLKKENTKGVEPKIKTKWRAGRPQKRRSPERSAQSLPGSTEDLYIITQDLQDLNDVDAKAAEHNQQMKEKEDLPTNLHPGWSQNNCPPESSGKDRGDPYEDTPMCKRKRWPHPSQAMAPVIKEEDVEEEMEATSHRDSGREISLDGSLQSITPAVPGQQYTPEEAQENRGSINYHCKPGTFTCLDCGMCFENSEQLELHHKVHTGEAPYPYTRPSQLGQHFNVQAAQKLFACSQCGQCFNLKANLIAHHKVHMGDKPFSCAECGRSFALRSSLEAHLPVHTIERPYSCQLCGKCFTSSSRLAVHHTTHTGDKTYECEDCGKLFTTSGSMNRHRRTHTGEKPYACMVCGKCFNRETNLYRHQMIHTR